MVKDDGYEDIWSYMNTLENSILFAADELRNGSIESAQLELDTREAYIDTRNAELAARYPHLSPAFAREKRESAQVIDWPGPRVKN